MSDEDNASHVKKCLDEHHFPLCVRAGLIIIYVDNGRILACNPPRAAVKPVVSAQDIEKLLSDAPVVKCGIATDTKEDEDAGWVCDQTGTHSVYSHTARLLLIEPLKQKSREERAMELLREIVKAGKNEEFQTFGYLAGKAEQLLSEGESK